MKRYPEYLIKKIKKVRKTEKLSFAGLSNRFNIPSSTIRNWCLNILNVGTRWDILTLSNEIKRKQIVDSEKGVAPKFQSFNKAKAKFIAGVLYGCEGSKYPATNRVAFSNSDPRIIVAFSELLKKSFDLDEDKFRIHLQIHSNQNYDDLRKKWSKLLSISEDKFIKPTITKPRGKKHRENYIGTCTLKYLDYRIQLKLIGIFEKFINQF